MTTRTTLTLSEPAAAIIEAAGNRSSYVTDLIEARWREWRAALGILSAAGWTSADVLAATAAVRENYIGQWSASGLGEAIGDAMRAAQQIGQVCTQYGASADEWSTLVYQVRTVEQVAFAVLVSARESATGNRAWREAVARVGEPAD